LVRAIKVAHEFLEGQRSKSESFGESTYAICNVYFGAFMTCLVAACGSESPEKGATSSDTTPKVSEENPQTDASKSNPDSTNNNGKELAGTDPINPTVVDPAVVDPTNPTTPIVGRPPRAQLSDPERFVKTFNVLDQCKKVTVGGVSVKEVLGVTYDEGLKSWTCELKVRRCTSGVCITTHLGESGEFETVTIKEKISAESVCRGQNYDFHAYKNNVRNQQVSCFSGDVFVFDTLYITDPNVTNDNQADVLCRTSESACNTEDYKFATGFAYRNLLGPNGANVACLCKQKW